MIDLGVAAQQVMTLVAGTRDDQLADTTPCPDYTVGELMDHIIGLTLAFRLAALKASLDDGAAPGQSGSAPELPSDWRERLPRQLDALVAAWRDPAAWEGETTAGGVTMPAAEMGVVTLDELVLHGWDLAQATGQPFHCNPVHVEAVLGFTTAVAEAGPEAREGLFGPPVDVPPDAPAFDRALGLAGRDPAWTP
ncbi:MAG: TIGR03086 family protein [Nitriliruptorales bacterium]|nr:TIGR03086 family protein [Nitriliruptorales bacterium]